MVQIIGQLTNDYYNLTHILHFLREFTFEAVLFRLMLAVFCGGLIGMERGRKRRPAGLRTYIIVCLGATLTMLLGQYESYMLINKWNEALGGVGVQTDVCRFSAQVINGVGFIGAGTILTTNRQETKGLTTAACLWASACMGIAIGAGFYEGVFLGFFMIFVAVCLLPRLEIMLHKHTRNMNIFLELPTLENLGEIIKSLKMQKVTIYDMDICRNYHPVQQSYTVNFSIRMKSLKDRDSILSELSELEHVYTVEEQKLGAL